MNKKEIYKKIIANIIVLLLAIIIIKFSFKYIISLLLPFILAYIIAKIANPPVKFLEKKIKIKRKYSSVVLIIGVLSGIVTAIYFIIQKIFLIIKDIVTNVSVITSTINEITLKIQMFIGNFSNDNNTEVIINNLSNTINSMIEKFSTSIIDKAGNVITFMPMFFMIFFITIISAYFMIKEDFTIRLSNFEKYPKFILIKKEIIDTLIDYLKGQFKIMFIIFIILTIGFGIINIKYFVLVAAITAFVDLLPIFGTGTIIYPWAAIELLYGDYKKALFLMIIYVIALLTRQILQPKIISTSIGLEVLPTLFFMFIGFKIFGVIGLITAPIIGLILIKLYKLGIFDPYKKCIIYILKDLKELLKIDF